MELQEVGWEHGLDWCGLEKGKMAGVYKRDNEPSVSIKCGEFLH